jgi:hypothetical protein
MTARSLARRLAARLPLNLHEAPELFGPTDLNAQSGNGRLAAGLNRAGTVTVLRWPRPAHPNHVAHHTTSRRAPRFGARDDEGAFLGLRVATAGGTTTRWLRDLPADQRYGDERSDAVRTTYRDADAGLRVTVRDVVAHDADVLVRDVRVVRDPGAPSPASVSLLAYANVDPVVSKTPWRPVQDLRRRRAGATRARYHPDLGAAVLTAAGVDAASGRETQVAVALGFDAPADAHQVGGHGDAAGAYAAAAGPLPGDAVGEGATTVALERDLRFEPVDGGGRREAARATVLVAAATTPSAVRRVLATARRRDPAAVRREKRAWVADLLADAPLPATDDPLVRATALRALVTLVANYDPDSGAVVASIAARSPYAQDWPRDGAFVNRVLDTIGRSDWARKRNRWYAGLQERAGLRVLGALVVPAGNWAMNYYADGTEAGPIPWEIDQTAYVVWSLWDHYRATGATEYLREVYPAIRRAADFLASHRDPATGLHRAAHEDDNVIPTRTTLGAGTVWLALDSAAKAARALDEEADAARYRIRREELAAAIDTHLWDAVAGAYVRGPSTLHSLLEHPAMPAAVRALPLVPATAADPTLAWPAGFDGGVSRMERHLDRVWASVAASFREPAAGERRFGMYETKALVALAKAWRGDDERMAQVRDGVRWVAREHATPDTHVLGEAWIREGGEVVAAVSQPHTLTGLLFYYASLQAFPPAGFADGPPGAPARGGSDGPRTGDRPESGRAGGIG